MINYEDNCCIVLKVWKGSVQLKALIYALPALVLVFAIRILNDEMDFSKVTGIDKVTHSFLWNAQTAVIGILLGFRTRQALGRFWEGTGLLHQMRGEWFDAASCLISFSRDARLHKGKHEEVQEFRQTLIRLMSLMHGTGLDEISGDDADAYEVLDVRGLDSELIKFLRDCKRYGFNRVEALQHMIQVLVTHNHAIGVLNIPPPILSRIYQTLSRGLVNLLNAKKIKNTVFPFPYAQLICSLLMLHSIFTPVMMSQVVESSVVAGILSFIPLFGMYGVNLVAIELEMPFGTDDNDLPLSTFQKEMNEALLMLMHDMADHLPQTSKDCRTSFEDLSVFMDGQGVASEGLPRSDSKAYMEDDAWDQTPPVPMKDRFTPIVAPTVEEICASKDTVPKVVNEVKATPQPAPTIQKEVPVQQPRATSVVVTVQNSEPPKGVSLRTQVAPATDSSTQPPKAGTGTQSREQAAAAAASTSSGQQPVTASNDRREVASSNDRREMDKEDFRHMVVVGAHLGELRHSVMSIKSSAEVLSDAISDYCENMSTSTTAALRTFDSISTQLEDERLMPKVFLGAQISGSSHLARL